MHIVFERTRDTEQRIQGQKKHEREHVIQDRESTSRVQACESLVPAGILYCMQLRKIITPQNFLSVWSKIIRKASLAHHKFPCFKKRPNISLHVEYSRTLIWFFEDFKFAYKTTKRNFGQKHKLQYLEKFAM